MDININLTNVNSLTNNNVDDYSPQISDKNVVWLGDDGNDNEIYFYDHNNASVTQLTDNDTYDSNAQISGTNVVWSSSDGHDNEIFFYNGTETIQLTDNDVNDGSLQIAGNNVAWLSYEGSSNYKHPPDSAIYLYNGTETVKLTDSDTYRSGFSLSGDKLVWSDYDGKDSEIYLYDGSNITQLTFNATSDYNPQILGDKVVWTNESEIYLYDGNKTIQLTDNDTYESNLQISANNVVWTAYDGNDEEIYLYDGNKTIQLTDNDTYEYSLQVGDSNVVWTAYDGNDSEIYVYNGSETIQLTDNDFDDYSPQISGNSIVWTSYDGNDDEIYLNFAPPLTPGEISGYKWNDLNGNGQFDADESGIAGWTIYLDHNENGQLDAGETSTVTDANGFYSFGDLKFGNYTVAEVKEPRWSQTYPFAYEYEWKDSKQPDGIAFDWVDISNVGTEVNLSDDYAADVTLPFSFSFYGKVYDALKISSNGYLTFDTNGSDPYNEAEDYQYNNYDDLEDTTYDNKGGAYRDDRVDIEPTSDIGGGFNVGWIESGEWLTYKVDIPYNDNYQVVARVASELDRTHRLDVSIDGQATVLNFDGTGGWQSWADATGDHLYLTAGSHELRLDMGSYGFNLNYIDLIPDRNSVNVTADSDELLVASFDDSL